MKARTISQLVSDTANYISECARYMSCRKDNKVEYYQECQKNIKKIS